MPLLLIIDDVTSELMRLEMVKCEDTFVCAFAKP
jgi:hypothetical protein